MEEGKRKIGEGKMIKASGGRCLDLRVFNVLYIYIYDIFVLISDVIASCNLSAEIITLNILMMSNSVFCFNFYFILKIVIANFP